MNIENSIILINDEDKTEEIVDCYQSEEDKLEVRFKNGESNTYNKDQIKLSTEGKLIELKNVVIYENEVKITNILMAIIFEEFNIVKIIFKNGENKLFEREQLNISDNGFDEAVVENNFMYFREVAKKLDLYNVYNNGVSEAFERISMINPNSALVDYLNPKEIETIEDFDFAIYPYGFNLRQQEAVEKAVTNKISIIESASIEERTEAILNITATVVLEGKNVIIVTKDNFSTLKYLEILKKSDIDFTVNHLKEEGNNFINVCEQWLRNSGSMFGNQNIADKKEECLNIQNELVEKLENIAKIESLEKEQTYLLAENAKVEKELQSKEVNIHPAILKFNQEKLLAFKEEYISIIKKQGHIGFFTKIMFIFKYSIWDFSFYDIDPELLEKAMEEVYNDRKVDEINEEIKALKNDLDKNKIGSEIEKIQEKSMEVLKCGLYENFKFIEGINTSQEEENEPIKKKVNYPILTSARDFFINSIYDNCIFDFVILDEAADMDIVTGVLALARGRNIIVVDDLNEIKTKLDEGLADELKTVFDMNEVNSGYKYMDNSLISSLNQVFKQVPKTELSRKNN
ncbi:hypothetical protein [Clostridium sp. YIM B02555]|uniref:hypothetical protein n=1 Tax=Clostridium sp. YIM B02555 TaxID=2911968 RepID=UPI001EEEF859|nr:hypothetical protein [Clostridium sp. YIM B02555]